MKKGQMILVSICALSVCIVIGIFLGRNLPNHYIQSAQHLAAEEVQNLNTEENIHTNEGPLNLNKATKTQLMELPGIGEILAQRILDYRDAQGAFETIEDLLNVQGIGEKKLEEIEPFVRIGG